MNIILVCDWQNYRMGQKRGTSLSFICCRARWCTVRARPSSCFVARRRTLSQHPTCGFLTSQTLMCKLQNPDSATGVGLSRAFARWRSFEVTSEWQLVKRPNDRSLTITLWLENYLNIWYNVFTLHCIVGTYVLTLYDVSFKMFETIMIRLRLPDVTDVLHVYICRILLVNRDFEVTLFHVYWSICAAAIISIQKDLT